MAYSHYWRQSRDFTRPEWTHIKLAFGALLKALPEKTDTAGGYHQNNVLRIAGGNGLGDPVVNDNRIIFNGGDGTEGVDEDLGHETMKLTRKRGAGIDGVTVEADSVKTARKPYDLLVCALLIVAEAEAPGAFSATSDGFTDEWRPALEFVNRVLPTGSYQLPAGIKPVPEPAPAEAPRRPVGIHGILRTIVQEEQGSPH